MTTSSFFDRLAGLFSGGAPTAPKRPMPAGGLSTASSAPARPVGFDFQDERIPDASRDRVLIVRGLIDDVGRRAASGELANDALLEIQRMHDEHLPRLLQSYIDIPPAHRAEIFRATGKSASFVLNDGLDKMAQRLRTLSRTLAQGDLDNFTRNLRFIETRYGDELSSFD
jgi:hypothetical protein